MEDQYKQLKGLHNTTGDNLTYIKQFGEWDDESVFPGQTYRGAPGNRNFPKSEIERFLTNVKKTFDLGIYLIESVKPAFR